MDIARRFHAMWSNTELRELYLSTTIRDFAVAFISLFIPLYLLKLGYSVSTVFVLFAIANGVHAFVLLPVAKFAMRFGYKHIILLSAPLLIVAYILLYTLPQFGWPLWIIAAIFGVKNAMFFLGYHVEFSKFSSENGRGREIGFMHLLLLSVNIIGPFLGGVIISYLGFHVAFIIASVLIMFSTIPLFLTTDIYDKTINLSLKGICKGQSIRNALVFAAYGMETSVTLSWYIFIFITILDSYTVFGAVASVAFFFSALVTIAVARATDKDTRKTLRIGAVLTSIGWGLRMLATTAFHVFAVDSFFRMAQTAIVLPFNARSYEKANHHINMVNFIIFRELFINGARVFSFLAFAYLFTFKQSFVVGAILSWVNFLF